MFTGLIEGTGKILKTHNRNNGIVLEIKPSFELEEPVIGESISVDGACLTLTEYSEKTIRADVSPETLKKTTLVHKRQGDIVNLERALRLSDRLGGHLVTGHIDGTGKILSITDKGDFTQFDFTAPDYIIKYIIEKGSVAIDGISLTVNSCSKTAFSVMIIPHTINATNLITKKTGERVNIENDIIGKYVEKLLTQEQDIKTGITKDFLEKYNFI